MPIYSPTPLLGELGLNQFVFTFGIKARLLFFDFTVEEEMINLSSSSLMEGFSINRPSFFMRMNYAF